jgi:hypothetical protein
MLIGCILQGLAGLRNTSIECSHQFVAFALFQWLDVSYAG